MSQDLKQLLKQELPDKKMAKDHEVRFIKKLDATLPKQRVLKYTWLNRAASIILLISFAYGGYTYFSTDEVIEPTVETTTTKTLSDVSPSLKKVEEYYLASINLELSKLKYTPETKSLFDGYIERLHELNNEYDRLSVELTENGPNELTINALIDNLKFRLNLLYRLKKQLKDLNTSESNYSETHQSI